MKEFRFNNFYLKNGHFRLKCLSNSEITPFGSKFYNLPILRLEPVHFKILTQGTRFILLVMRILIFH